MDTIDDTHGTAIRDSSLRAHARNALATMIATPCLLSGAAFTRDDELSIHEEASGLVRRFGLTQLHIILARGSA